MSEHTRWLILLGAQVVLLLLWQGVASALVPWGLYPYIGGVFIVFAALYLEAFPAMLLAVVTGLATDAALPFPFGLSAGLYLAGSAVILYWRHRLRRENNTHATLTALGATGVFHGVITLVAGAGGLGEARYWGHAGWDLLVSLAVTAVVAPWFFDLQRVLLRLGGIDLDAEDKPV